MSDDYVTFENKKIHECVLPNLVDGLPEPESAGNILAWQLSNSNLLPEDIVFGNVTKEQMLNALDSINRFVDHEKFMAMPWPCD